MARMRLGPVMAHSSLWGTHCSGYDEPNIRCKWLFIIKVLWRHTGVAFWFWYKGTSKALPQKRAQLSNHNALRIYTRVFQLRNPQKYFCAPVLRRDASSWVNCNGHCTPSSPRSPSHHRTLASAGFTTDTGRHRWVIHTDLHRTGVHLQVLIVISAMLCGDKIVLLVSRISCARTVVCTWYCVHSTTGINEFYMTAGGLCTLRRV
jgi:hypothetical protein